MQKMKLEENTFKFPRNIFIRLQKESRSLPRQLHSNYQCSCKLHWRENICAHNSFHKIFYKRVNLSYNCPLVNQLTWDTSTENFLLDVNSYKDPMGKIAFQVLPRYTENVLSSNF